MGNLVFQATLGGQVNLVGPNTASTYNLNVPAVSSTIATTSGTETLTNKTLTTPVINGFTGDTSVVNIGSGQFYKDTSGNIGIGVTPSAWGSSYKALQMSYASIMNASSGGYYGSNFYYNSSNNPIYVNNGYALAYSAYSAGGAHLWLTAPSGTAGNAITWTQAMTLDASGNLGVGTTSPASYGVIAGYKASGTASYIVGANGGGCQTAIGVAGDNESLLGTLTNHALRICTNSTERARIDSSGNLLVGGTSQATGTGTSKVSITAGTTNGVGVNCGNGAAGINVNLTSTGGYYGYWNYNGSFLGAITTNGSTITYGGTSDYRLKENIQPMTDALSKVAALKPCTYTWKNSGVSGQGFVAHELAEVCPDAVHGEKDAVNEDGSIKPQMIDTSFLVATLTAALQEAHGLIKDLQARITALEA